MPGGPEPEFLAPFTCKPNGPSRSDGRRGGSAGATSTAPCHSGDARDALIEVWQRAETQRVEVACSGGRGRTGTALACIASLLHGVTATDAIGYVRTRYDQHAVETPWQRWFVARFPDRLGGSICH